jgi:hypothetical protein
MTIKADQRAHTHAPIAVPGVADAHALEERDGEQDDQPEAGEILVHLLEVVDGGAADVAAEEGRKALLQVPGRSV